MKRKELVRVLVLHTPEELLKREWLLCGHNAEKVICDCNCIECNQEKRVIATQKFKEKYYVKKGKVLPIRQNTKRKSPL